MKFMTSNSGDPMPIAGIVVSNTGERLTIKQAADKKLISTGLGTKVPFEVCKDCEHHFRRCTAGSTGGEWFYCRRFDRRNDERR